MLLVSKFYRGKIVESFHVGYATAIDENGETIFTAGEPDYPVFIRSAAKPFQAIPLLELGAAAKYELTDEELTVICASHNGEPFHTETVANILKKGNISIDDLDCGTHIPLDKPSYEQLILQGRRPTALHNNCSGKHAGMLILAKTLDASLDNYTDVEHPVQQKILEKIKLYSEIQKIPVVLDDCNAPTFFIPLKNLALMYKKLAQGADEYLQKIFHVVNLHPKHLAGRGRFDSDFIAALSGRAVSKIGAEGIRGIGIRTEQGKNIGIALKVLSGSRQAADTMAVAILRHLKLLDEETLKKLEKYSTPILRSYSDKPVGKVITEISIGKNE